MAAIVDYSRSPHFFKVFLPELSSQFLSIPPAFREYLKPECPGIATLRGPSGNSWHADLAVDSNTLFFGNGWKDFVADHSIVAGDFLIFRYDGKLHFTVLIFDVTACEKKSAFLATPCQKDVDAAGQGSKSGTGGDGVVHPSACSKEEEKEEDEKEEVGSTGS